MQLGPSWQSRGHYEGHGGEATALSHRSFSFTQRPSSSSVSNFTPPPRASTPRSFHSNSQYNCFIMSVYEASKYKHFNLVIQTQFIKCSGLKLQFLYNTERCFFNRSIHISEIPNKSSNPFGRIGHLQLSSNTTQWSVPENSAP